jgi:Mg2+ and Co2+ transporter CorA
LEEALRDIHPWRRTIAQYRVPLDRAIAISGHQSRSGSQSWDDLLVDFKELEGQRSALEARVDRITSAVSAIIAIDEHKKAANNATGITSITYLAFFFVPLSLLAGVFSMDTNFPNRGSAVYWVFAIMAIPVTLGPLLIALQYERLASWVNEGLRKLGRDYSQ